jgi:hypothetical protein
MTKYFVDDKGAYLGGFVGAEPPPGAIEVPGAARSAGCAWPASCAIRRSLILTLNSNRSWYIDRRRRAPECGLDGTDR